MDARCSCWLTSKRTKGGEAAWLCRFESFRCRGTWTRQWGVLNTAFPKWGRLGRHTHTDRLSSAATHLACFHWQSLAIIGCRQPMFDWQLLADHNTLDKRESSVFLKIASPQKQEIAMRIILYDSIRMHLKWGFSLISLKCKGYIHHMQRVRD